VTGRYVTAPAHVAACDLGTNTATVLVNYRTGGVHTLIGPSARWWAELATTSDPAATTVLDPQDAARLLDQLRTAGLLRDSPQPRPWPAPAPGQPWRLSFGTQELQAGLAPVPAVPVRTLIGAAVAVGVALYVRHVGDKISSMDRLLRLLTWAHSRTNRPAPAELAEQAVYAVRRVGLLMPARVACLEESAAVVLLLAASHHGVTWCHGVAADPIRLHAWVETGHGPVAEPASTARYTPIRIIPQQNPKQGDHD
jgi:hypothetical protein